MGKIKFILGKKIGMSQVFDDQGKIIPVTLIEAGPCSVTQIKAKDKDGYNALQIGFGKAKNLKKPQKGHLKKSKLSDIRWLKEFRIENGDAKELNPGSSIKADIFKEGDIVDVSGISRGKGFQGVIKRHNFSRGPESHGSDHHREPGSIGSAFPQRVIKGRKLPGQLGATKVKIKNLKVVKINSGSNLICLEGAIPGASGGLIMIEAKND
jgi:large subunit ribosomal protein L3